MENEEILDEEIVKEDKNEVLDDNSSEEIRKNNDLIAKLKSLVFEDKQVEFPNRKKIKIINQIDDEVIADIEYANTPSKEGTLIKASDMNCIKELVLDGYAKSDDALKIANEAKNISNGAPPTFDPDTKANSNATNIDTDNIKLWRDK